MLNTPYPSAGVLAGKNAFLGFQRDQSLLNSAGRGILPPGASPLGSGSAGTGGWAGAAIQMWGAGSRWDTTHWTCAFEAQLSAGGALTELFRGKRVPEHTFGLKGSLRPGPARLTSGMQRISPLGSGFALPQRVLRPLLTFSIFTLLYIKSGQTVNMWCGHDTPGDY